LTKEDSITVTVKFPTYEAKQDWLPSTYFCPNCGKQKVYVESGDGDYYEGATHICVACKSRFSIPTCYAIELGDIDDSFRQIVNQLPK
jgi:transcription elongation factor Elf1